MYLIVAKIKIMCLNRAHLRRIIYDPHIRRIKFRKLTYLICLVKFIQILYKSNRCQRLFSIIFRLKISSITFIANVNHKRFLQVDKLLILSFQCKIGRVWKHMYLCRSSWCSPSHSYMCKYYISSAQDRIPIIKYPFLFSIPIFFFF